MGEAGDRHTTEKEKYQFAEVGVIVHARVTERNEKLGKDRVGLEAQFEVSSVTSGGNLPVIQHVRSLASLDDPKKASTTTT